ncbi:MAG: hypothetical protein JXR94_06980 [Candidatus Hydrogenedentes bacterium]|nr:hypothetical protein [Candidatus Hydrogenedentota bacterium]
MATEAGGRGLGTEPGGRGAPLFQSVTDADYVRMRDALNEGRDAMLAHPRVDMPRDSAG